MVKIDSEWHLVYTRPGSERKVAASLGKKKIEYYCPLNEVQSKAGKVNKTFVEPLFPSRLFVKISNQQFKEVRQTRDVINFLYWLNRPVVVKNCDIKSIKEFLDERINVQLEKIPVTSNANKAIIEQLVLSGAILGGVLNKSRRLTLPSLGYAMVSHESRNKVEEVEVFKAKNRPLERFLMRVQFNYRSL